MTTPPNIQTPAYKPTKPDSPLFTTDSDSNVYVTPYTTPCHFTLSTFLHVLKELTLHPERNSSLILRADPIPLDTQSQLQSTDLDLDGGPRAFILENDLEKVDEVRVRLMPKQPKRDGKLDQRVVFYRSKEKVEHDHPARVVDGQASSSSSNLRSRPDEEKEMELEKGLVVMIPMVKVVEDIPFFHPPVRNLVFYYEERPELPEDQLEEELARLSTKDTNRETESMGNQPAEEESNPLQGRISISYLPFPPTTLKTVTDNEAPVSTLPPISTPLPFEGIRRASLPRKRSPLAGPRAAPPAPTETSQKEDQKVTEARLDRTCLALLERVYKHGFGQMVGYKKRVNHDTVVKREPFQDLYLVLKDRHRHLDSRAPKAGSSKVEDLKRHVWKKVKSQESSLPESSPCSTTFFTSTSDISDWGSQDVAIAAFLMLLWKDMYPARPPTGSVNERDTWGRPENGFVDLGCGNGLLVHILVSEGYLGKGYELRARRTWPLYPPKTQAALVEAPLDPPSWFPDTLAEWQSGSWLSKDKCVIEANTFLIGNHADELTPWLPLLSLIPTRPVPHLSLPCCLHKWDSAFMHANFKPPPHPHSPEGNFEEGLEAGQSRYKSYLMWLGWVGLQCGWSWETEPLRIPSTRGWGIVARNRWAGTIEELEECRIWALEQVLGVRERGNFKIRIKEGKEH